MMGFIEDDDWLSARFPLSKLAACSLDAMLAALGDTSTSEKLRWRRSLRMRQQLENVHLAAGQTAWDIVTCYSQTAYPNTDPKDIWAMAQRASRMYNLVGVFVHDHFS